MALFLFCANRPLVCNSQFYTAAHQCAAILPLLWCAVTLQFYIPDTGKLTVGAYKAQHKALVSSSRAAAICLWAVAAAALLSSAFHPSGDLPCNLLCVLGFGGSGALFLVIGWFENLLKYNITGSGNKAPQDGFDIE